MKWTNDELTVLMALFISQPFAAGDDGNPRNAKIAKILKRKPSAIDRQWRNIKYRLFRLDLAGAAPNHIGHNVKTVVDQYRTNLGQLRSDALAALESNGWKGLRRYL